jgi:hypothetical protein
LLFVLGPIKITETNVHCVDRKLNYYERSQKCEKRLLSLSCQSVRPHEKTRIPREEIFMKIDF